MSKATIDYLNARRACKPATGGTVYDRAGKYAPHGELDLYEQTELETDARCSAMLFAVEMMQQQLFERFGILPAETVDEIPF